MAHYIPDPSLGGRAVYQKYGSAYMSKLGKHGLEALAQKYFQGDIEKAKTWLGQCGVYAYDKHYRARGWGVMPEPEPLQERIHNENEEV